MRRTLLRNIFADTFVMHSKSLKRVEDQIHTVEKNFKNLKSKIMDYCSGKDSEGKHLRHIAKAMTKYAEEEHNITLQASLNNFSTILYEVNKQLELFTEKLDGHVVNNLANVKSQIKHLKKDLKCAVNASDAERISQEQLQRFQLQSDQQQDRIAVAAVELEKAKKENAKATNIFKEHAEVFENQKLVNIRGVLLTWTSLELQFHARALELFTDAHAAALAIDATADLEGFRSKIHAPEMRSSKHRLEVVKDTTLWHLETLDAAKAADSQNSGDFT